MQTMTPLRLALATCLFVALAAGWRLAAADETDPPGAEGTAADLEAEQRELNERVATLIEQLGADEYAVREKAQQELEDLGLAAFDALHEAQHHKDIEIAHRARYLVRRLKVNWAREDDSPEVKRILGNYGDQNAAERKNRMERLAALPEAEGVEPLCRLVRFESDDVLSKRAAILVISRSDASAEDGRERLARLIGKSVGISKRKAAEWLRTFVLFLREPEGTTRQWEELVSEEYEALKATPDDPLSREIVRDLLRWQAEMLAGQQRHSDALAAMRRTIDLLDGSREELISTLDWLMEREAWEIVDEVAGRHASAFDEHPELLYRLAEAHARRGNKDAAEAAAEKAISIQADEPERHLVVALTLADRGLFEWAEREYRYVMEVGPAGSLNELRARFLLSEMLHDGEKELAAAEVLQGTVDAMEKDPTVLQNVERVRDPGQVNSRMHYFYARHHLAAGDKEKFIAELDEAIKHDPTDADVLIAMYQIEPPSDAWRKRALQRIDAAVGQFRTKIREYRALSEQVPGETLRDSASDSWAMYCNQFAWLVGNTQGDFDEAIEMSHKSLELRPDTAGYYDTLGRCYFAKGDVDSAVKYQTIAVNLEPHSGQIRRQLDFFQEAQAKQSKD